MNQDRNYPNRPEYVQGNRQTHPGQAYNYAPRDQHSGSYDTYPQPQNRGSQIHPQKGSQVQQHRGSQVHPQDYNRDPNFRGYASYRQNKDEYKYNFFSMFDEPWNRCCQVGKCGSFPGNECIARDNVKNNWH